MQTVHKPLDPDSTASARDSVIERRFDAGIDESMARAIYIVIFSRGRWWVDLEGKAFGPFPDLQSATQEAVSLARFLTHTGRPSEVRVPDSEGHFAIAWESEPYRYRVPAPQAFATGASAAVF